MRSLGSHSTPGREKEGNEERTGRSIRVCVIYNVTIVVNTIVRQANHFFNYFSIKLAEGTIAYTIILTNIPIFSEILFIHNKVKLFSLL